MFKRIVRRKGDGKYAVKKYVLFIGWEYRDVGSKSMWWFSKEFVDKYRWTDDYDKVLRLFDSDVEFGDEEVIKKE